MNGINQTLLGDELPPDASSLLPIPVDGYVVGDEITRATDTAPLILKQAKEVEVTDEQTNEEAGDILNRARQSMKYFEATRVSMVKPLNNYVKDINTRFKSKVAPLVEADEILSKKTGDYHREKLRKQREEEARIEKERREREAELRKREEARAAAEARPVEEVVVPEVQAVPEVKKTTVTASGSKTTMREDKQRVVVDENLVPREYCSPDAKKLKAAPLDLEIPGTKVDTNYIPVTG